jgi:hypothetical protein
MKARQLTIAAAIAAAVAFACAAQAQQRPPLTPPASTSGSKANQVAAALFIGGALGAWWADARVDKAVKDVADKFRTTHTASNGDVTVTQKDADGHVLERTKTDKHGVEKDYEKRRWVGEVCVFEEHMQRQRDGGHVHHVIQRDKDGKLVGDERNVFDKDGRHVAGTRTRVDADGKSTTQTYDRDTNTWR